MFFNLEQLLNCDTAIILENPLNISYLTQCNINEGFLIIDKFNKYLFVDDRFFLDVDVAKDINIVRLKNFKHQLQKFVSKFNIKTILLESDYVTLHRYNNYLSILPNVEIVTNNVVSECLLKMRSVKTREEIQKIKEAQRLSDEAFDYIIGYIRQGRTERDIAIELEQKLLDLGSEKRAFDFIVVSGARAAIPHGKPTDKIIENGDFVTIDFGATVDGYHSDMTRTVAVGNISDQQREVYNVVLTAQQKAIDSVSAGVVGSYIDKIARDYISKSGYGEFFTHSLGHGVGLEVHESPVITTKSQDVLQSGEIVTIEPGVYIPHKFGVRIEDMVLVNDDGFEDLTAFDKNLICI